MRIGHGYDVHAFCEGDAVVLGGVTIEHTHALKAHSDGDVVLHAVCDALLGAAAMGDIGEHFPDTDSTYENSDSRELLRHVVALLKDVGLKVVNVDVTVIAQAPKLILYKGQMKTNIARDLNAALHQVNVKATTTEELGYIGRKEGIAVHAVALIA